ncbi:MAG TPA: alpha/beta fold hydrolase [Steroidobacteraceae bacterium]
MPAAAVVYVHGLWMTGIESVLLRRRLARQRGYRFGVFHYRSVRAPLPQILSALRDAIDAVDAPQVHLLGHSLGGLLIQRCLARYPMRQPGRVVFLGTPAAGSRAARRLARLSLGLRVLGAASAEELLAAHPRRWDIGRELGIIAGTLPFGFGRLLLKFDEDNDGTVAVSETQLAGAAGFLGVPTTHSGLLWSARVAREAGSFLEYGSFGK